MMPMTLCSRAIADTSSPLSLTFTLTTPSTDDDAECLVFALPHPHLTLDR
jgi:hypothetical protein